MGAEAYSGVEGREAVEFLRRSRPSSRCHVSPSTADQAVAISRSRSRSRMAACFSWAFRASGRWPGFAVRSMIRMVVSGVTVVMRLFMGVDSGSVPRRLSRLRVYVNYRSRVDGGEDGEGGSSAGGAVSNPFGCALNRKSRHHPQRTFPTVLCCGVWRCGSIAGGGAGAGQGTVDFG